jgi:hypothetical protein
MPHLNITKLCLNFCSSLLLDHCFAINILLNIYLNKIILYYGYIDFLNYESITSFSKYEIHKIHCLFIFYIVSKRK